MPSLADTPLITRRDGLHEAAANRHRVRICGEVIDHGAGYSARYRNTWLTVRAAGATIRLTASNGTPLGTCTPGTHIDVVCTLTGMLDLTDDTFHAEKARLIERTPPA